MDSNGRFHSVWLSMMYPRLKLARNLLTDDGFIFVSIDDHEVHSLLAVMAHVFGRANFVGLITRATGTPTGGGFDGLTNMVDYLVVFRRSTVGVLNGVDFGDQDEAIYNQEDERGRYLTRSLRRTGGEDRREDRPSMHFGLTAPDGTEVYPTGPTGYESRWICGRQRYDELLAQGLIEWRQVDGGRWHPYQRFYLEGRSKRPSNLWSDLEGNKKGTRELRDLFDGRKVFESPKPVALIQRIIEIATGPDSIVLDFFAGSGTTAQATIAANLKDDGSRRFVLVQMAEAADRDSDTARAEFGTIAEVTRERLRRAGLNAIDRDAPTHDVGFRCLRVDTTNMTCVFRTPDEAEQAQLDLEVDSVKPDRTGEDLLFQVLLDSGLELTLPVSVERIDGHEVFVVDDGALICCFEKVSLDLVRALAKREPLRAVFLDAGFGSDDARINAEQIFRELSPSTDVRAI